jgi:hypothetical protein
VIYEKQQASEKHQSQLCLNYFLLLHATCFDFCGKPSSGNTKNTSREAIQIQPLKCSFAESWTTILT